MSKRKGPGLVGMGIAIAIAAVGLNWAQNGAIEKSFPQSKLLVEKSLKTIEPTLSGSLPVLDGFTNNDRVLDRYQRAYYRCTASVSSSSSGLSKVRMVAKITAWYNDPDSTKSGYQVLPSNGRLEGDCLDRLEQALNGSSNLPAKRTPETTVAAVPTVSAPMPGGHALSDAIAASKTPLKSSAPPSGESSIGRTNEAPSVSTQKAVTDRHIEELKKEAKNLQEIIHNQSHPDNLVAVRKTGTPVLASPAEGAKVLFLADAEDEFELLDKNAGWVHVRVSGLSRGWIRRSGVEMNDSTVAALAAADPSEKRVAAAKGASVLASEPEALQVESEQISSFPGNWPPLRGKTVKIISVRKTNPAAPGTDGAAKLDFAKGLLSKEYVQLSRTDTTAAGLVVIFDSEDGGMLAATFPVLQQWTSGSLSDAAFWRRCFFDPPDAFHVSNNP